jgi:hypothetical protein
MMRSAYTVKAWRFANRQARAVVPGRGRDTRLSAAAVIR